LRDGGALRRVVPTRTVRLRCSKARVGGMQVTRFAPDGAAGALD
jgi:hypothetical protein